MTEPKSRLQVALEGRERYQHSFDVAPFFGADELPALIMRVPTKTEEIRAITMAYVDAAKLTKAAGDAADEAKHDADLIGELKTINVLFFACRDAEDPERHAFIHPEWMRDNLDGDTLGCLLRLLEECRKHRGPLPWEIDADRVDAVRRGCVEAWETDVPEVVLAAMDHTYLTSLMVYAMKQWDEDRTRMQAQIDALEGGDAEG